MVWWPSFNFWVSCRLPVCPWTYLSIKWGNIPMLHSCRVMITPVVIVSCSETMVKRPMWYLER